MADYKVTDTELISVANAIRTKGGTQSQLTFPSGFVSAVNNINSDTSVLVPKTITQNGTYDPDDDDADGYSEVTVNVPEENPFSLNNYIESSGTQWIDTGYITSGNTRFELVATFLDNQPDYSTMIGARDEREGIEGNPVIFGPGTTYFILGWGSVKLSTGISSTPYKNKKAVYIINNLGYGVNTEFNRPCGFGDYTGLSPLTSNSIYIFSLNAAGSEYGVDTRCKAKLYRLRIFENNVLVHEYIPWQENGIACLKDTVASAIKYNAGTGNFVYGTDAS